MRVLIASTHGAGHFGPLVPFAEACLRSEHEVIVVGPPTLDPVAVDAYRKALEVLADLPVRVLLTSGRELDLGPVPDNVHVERWVPQQDVLAHAAAVVCHGGSGTMLGALAAGKPTVLTPLFADQPHNAVRVAAVGAGVVTSIDRLRTAIERVLEEERYRLAAEHVAEEMRRLPAVDAFLADGGPVRAP
ncbi:MAG TPA: nucleotide disphospho-sugar-binding domain-containing protein [Gaiellaceae bacterium]|jgi:UDP:flavonoid glycosyltransferase YjiC (YdhE family)